MVFAHPARSGGGDRQPPPQVQRGIRAKGAVRPVVLFVEDHELLRHTVANDLRDAGYTVMTAGRGEEALAILRGPTKVDALLTDLRLPGPIDGWDIAEQARMVRSGLPVIYASAYSYKTPRQVPGSVILGKPYKREELEDALDSMLS